MKRRVVITGMGAITPLGHSVRELYESQLEARSGVDFITLFDASTFPTKFAAEVKAFDLGEYEQELHTTPAHLADYFGLEGPNYNCLTACAASSQALGEAAELIRNGEAEIMLSGGAHSMIHPFGVTGFNLLTALSTNNEDP